MSVDLIFIDPSVLDVRIDDEFRNYLSPSGRGSLGLNGAELSELVESKVSRALFKVVLVKSPNSRRKQL